MHYMPTLALDYMSMHSTQIQQKETGMLRLVVTKDLKRHENDVCQCGWSYRERAYPQAIKRVGREINQLGHADPVMKSNGANAMIVALKQRVK